MGAAAKTKRKKHQRTKTSRTDERVEVKTLEAGREETEALETGKHDLGTKQSGV